MKKPLLLIALTIACLHCFAQKTNRIDSYIFSKTISGEGLVIAEMPFGKAGIIKITGDTSGMVGAADFFVDVIYTDYPSGESLQQLNQNRLNSFLKRFPFIKRKQLVQVNFFRQMDGAEKQKAETMFHGLLVRYRPRQSVEAMKRDIDNLDDMILAIENDTSIEIKRTLSKADRDSILLMLRIKKGQIPKSKEPVKYESRPYDIGATGYDKTKRSPKDSLLYISPRAALKKGLITKAAYKAYNWTPWITLYFHQVGDTTRPIHIPALTREITARDTLREQRPAPVPDSTLLKIFSRVHWKNFSIVGDVTVSMYPYSAQLLLWLNIHTVDSVTQTFVFFNDGDEMPDNEKHIGNTGGIYSKTCRSFGEVKKQIRETMLKGSGGDRPENDIEALLQGEKDFPSRDFQVLIADNKAPIKDKALISRLTKPVRIVLCGANDYDVNMDYLELARRTGGSVHLLQEDIYDLAFLKEGESVKIGKKDYKIQNGSFVENNKAD